MIQFAEILKIVKELQIEHCRVFDVSDNKIYDISCQKNQKDCSAQLKNAEGILSGYGRVIIKGATADIYRCKWKGSYDWEVVFNNAAAVTPGVGAIAPAANAQILDLTLQFEKFKQKVKNEEFEKSLKEKYEAKNKFGFDPSLLIGGALLFGEKFGIDKAKIAEAAKIMGMAGNFTIPVDQPQQTAAGLSGPGTQTETGNKLVLQTNMSDEELSTFIVTKLNEVNMLVDSTRLAQMLVDLKKIMDSAGADKTLMLIKGVADNPQFVDTALTFIK